MTQFFDLDEANEVLPEVREILAALREERAELIRLRDEVLLHRTSAETPASAPTEANVGGTSRSGDPADSGPEPGEDPTTRDPEVRILRLRMQGVIDRMQAGVARIDELGITLREIETGLIDFPALANGRQVWLCWRLGEGPIEDSRPPRFANVLGAVFLTTATLAFMTGFTTVGWVLSLIVTTLASFAAISGICVGCEMYAAFARARGIQLAPR